MLLIILSVYVIVLLIVWGFFIVARMHSMKFKNFSSHISPITNLLMIILIILSLLGFIFIFYMDLGDSNYELNIKENKTTNNKEIDKKSYEEEIIGNDYY